MPVSTHVKFQVFTTTSSLHLNKQTLLCELKFVSIRTKTRRIMTSSVKCALQCAVTGVLLLMSSYSGFQKGQVKNNSI